MEKFMALTLFLLLIEVWLVNASRDLCTGSTCPRGTVCKLVEICAPLCAAVPQCVTQALSRQAMNPCQVGAPMITMSGYEKACRVGGANCPGGLTCVGAHADQGRCCPIRDSGVQLAKTKPGSCPVLPSYGICFNLCNNDMDCPRSDKCCSNGCGYACAKTTGTRSAARRISGYRYMSVDSSAPEGVCPEVRSYGDCVHTCRSDGDCGQGKKCCSNGCGRTCQAIVPPPKPGTCPKDFTNDYCMGEESDHCNNDVHCRGSEKCCSTNCGRRCRSPNSVPAAREGVCPSASLSSGAVFSCRVKFDLCQHDIQCPSGMKCCGTECGKKCRDVLPKMAPGKAGRCPAPEVNEYGTGSSLCISFCSKDADCPMTQKCCMRADKCSYMCTHPEQ